MGHDSHDKQAPLCGTGRSRWAANRTRRIPRSAVENGWNLVGLGEHVPTRSFLLLQGKQSLEGRPRLTMAHSEFRIRRNSHCRGACWLVQFMCNLSCFFFAVVGVGFDVSV